MSLPFTGDSAVIPANRFLPVKPFTHQLRGEGHHRKQNELPAPTELNYDAPPGRIPRMAVFGLSYMAGLAAWPMQQWFDTAWLPPVNVAAVMARTNRGTRAVGGVLGAGTTSAATQHIPSVRVPRVVT